MSLKTFTLFYLMTDQPDNEPMEEENVAEDSQEIVFSLHLTQSQADMDSQAPFETILPMEEIQEVMKWHCHEDELKSFLSAFTRTQSACAQLHVRGKDIK